MGAIEDPGPEPVEPTNNENLASCSSPETQKMKKMPTNKFSNQSAPMDMVLYNNSAEPDNRVTEVIPRERVQVNYNIDNSSGSLRHDWPSLLLFLLHAVAVGLALGYLIFLGVKRALTAHFHMLDWYPKLAAAAGIGALFSCIWPALISWQPRVMVRGVLYSTPIATFAASVLLLSASVPANVGLGVVLLSFSICQALYACWVTPRVEYASAVLARSLEPATKMIPDLHHPSYWITVAACFWALVWSLGVVGAISNQYSALIILGLLVSFAWTMEVLRNVVSVTISRVMALFYIRGMQSDIKFSFGKALKKYLGTVVLGSLLIPLVEFLRALARVLNLIDQDDEFMFSCAYCCLRVVDFLFRFGNSWAFIQVGAYGKGFVKASRDTWSQFQLREMEPVVDRDITSALCFLSGIAGGSLCVLACGSWTLLTHKHHTATISILSFIIGYFMSRIGMAVLQACVCAYYVCYAENPYNRYFDNTIPDRIKQFRALTGVNAA